MNISSNRLTIADKLAEEIRIEKVNLRKSIENNSKYISLYDRFKKKFITIHDTIRELNTKVQQLTDNIEITSNRRRRSSRKKRTYIQRLIDDAEKKRDLLMEKLNINRKNALGMEEVIYLTEEHLKTPQKNVDKISSLEYDFSNLTSRGMGKKTKNRRIKKNQTKTKRRKPTRRRKKPKKKKN
mgnify:CR=1 FL=1